MGKQSSRLVIVSARAPFVADGAAISRAPGGLVSALLPLLRRTAGTWIAAGNDVDADATSDPTFRVIPVSIPPETRAAWYVEASTEALWPLAHGFIERCRFKAHAARAYEDVNRRVAEVVSSVAPLRGTVWVHDYQLAFVPALVRARRPDLTIGYFWHVPWPSIEFFRALPWCRNLIQGLLGADVIGFHVPRYVRAFASALCEMGIKHEVEHEKLTVTLNGRICHVVACPVGADVPMWSALGRDARVHASAVKLREQLGGSRVLLAVDRLDYTKGIVERLDAYERLLERSADACERVTLVQIAVPSRESVAAYRVLRERVDGLAGRIVRRFGTPTRTPIHLFARSFEARDLAAFYLAADVALVTPMRDGMNLVAFEYVATRSAAMGRLVLSELAGAADVLHGANLVNPYDEDALDEVLAKTALLAETNDDAARMVHLQHQVSEVSLDRWTSNFLAHLDRARGCGLGDGQRRFAPVSLRNSLLVLDDKPSLENLDQPELRSRLG